MKIHDVIQIEEDLTANIKKKSKAVIDALKNGVILWGQETVIKVIKNV